MASAFCVRFAVAASLTLGLSGIAQAQRFAECKAQYWADYELMGGPRNEMFSTHVFEAFSEETLLEDWLEYLKKSGNYLPSKPGSLGAQHVYQCHMSDSYSVAVEREVKNTAHLRQQGINVRQTHWTPPLPKGQIFPMRCFAALGGVGPRKVYFNTHYFDFVGGADKQRMADEWYDYVQKQNPGAAIEGYGCNELRPGERAEAAEILKKLEVATVSEGLDFRAVDWKFAGGLPSSVDSADVKATDSGGSSGNSDVQHCIKIDRESNPLSSFLVSSCAKKVWVKWFDQGSCRTGCASAVNPNRRSTITTVKGEMSWAACPYPMGPRNQADGKAWKWGQRFVCR